MLISFARTVLAGTGWALEPLMSLPGRCALTRVHLVIPPGPAGTLHVRPVWRDGSGMDHDIPRYPAGHNEFFSGDNLQLELSTRQPLARSDRLSIWVRNTGLLDHTYTLVYEVETGGGLHG